MATLVSRPIVIGSNRRVPLLPFLLLPILVSLSACFAFYRHHAPPSIAELSNLVGPTTDSLLHHRGLTACVTSMGTPGNPICFHGGRMPLPSVIVALGVGLFGDHFTPIVLFKTMLLLIPILLAIGLVWRRLSAARARQFWIALLLLVPFGMTPFLADVVNLQVEEAYSYSFLALAVAILLFEVDGIKFAQRGIAVTTTVLFALSVDAIYLAKSSMLLVAFALTLAFIGRVGKNHLRVLVLVLVACAPAGWALYQHHASGRYSLGTSIDGINLHKGNNDFFIAHYPPPPGQSLDVYDVNLNVGHTFADEWSFNKFHQDAAIVYIRTHPRQTLDGDLRKLYVIFLTTQKFGSSDSHGLMLKLETASIILLRFLLWAAIALSIYGLLRRRSWAASGLIFLALVVACTIPYLLGFAYIRHISILIYPSVLLLCAVLTRAEVVPPPRQESDTFSHHSEAVHYM